MSLVLCASACTRTGERTYALQGQVVSLDRKTTQATIKHEEIKGFMPAMTMPYKVREAGALDAIQPGDLVNAMLVVVADDAYLVNVKKVGSAPLEKTDAPPSAAVLPLQPGDEAPDGLFVDQDGKMRQFSSFKGTPILLTFVYTRCPVPDFCPLMDRHFEAIQDAATSDRSLKPFHLVSISFDPITDTPAVLKQHAQDLHADPSRWTFLTGKPDDIDQFARRFGVAISRAKDNPLDITHTLRTAIIDRDGKVTKIYVGNEWTPAEAIADLKRVG